MKFDTVLIANRGEIAVRIARTASARGLRTVGVYTDADRGSPHLLAVDRAIHLADETGGLEPYLDGARLIAAAIAAGAQAVHPGYGFLSENADFAEACAKAGLCFVGPTPAAIRLMADKGAAKRHVKNAGVSCIPGYDDLEQSDARLSSEAERIGAPLLIKAVAGGGGRGMRRVDKLSEFGAALASARSEAKRIFGSPVVILERALDGVRHVEVQIAGDEHGNIVHLGERDCSCQRRNQKVIEEAPSPMVDAALRDALGQAAVRVAEAVAYTGVGTIEFLVTQDNQFYFMEMNTRLQVEHPVTEAITGEDLVAWQFQIAAGEPLPRSQSDIRFAGAAIEARVYAEDPANGFRPQTGIVTALRMPNGEGLRIDHAMTEGLVVSPRYDPMLAKVIASGESRELARRRLLAALGELRIEGVATNNSFLMRLLDQQEFRAGAADTQFCERIAAAPPPKPDTNQILIAAALEYRRRCDRWRGRPEDWSSLGPALRLFFAQIGGQERRFRARLSGNKVDIAEGDDNEPTTVTFLHCPDGEIARVSDEAHRFRCQHAREGVDVAFGSLVVRVEAESAYGRSTTRDDQSSMNAPMSGRILRALKAAGDVVEPGDVVLVLEAMKMEFALRAGRRGRIEKLCAGPGDQVNEGDLLVSLAD